MNDIVLIGGGGHCKSVIDVIEQGNLFRIAGIVDQSKPLGYKICGYSVIGSDADLASLAKVYKHAVVTVGQIESASLRVKLFNLAIQAKFILPSIVSPRAYISKHATLGKGSVIMHDVLINAGSSIGDNCIINSKALVEHDVSIGDHCHIATGSIINGGVVINGQSFIGSNSVIKQNTIVAEGSFIKFGSAVK